MTVTFSQIQFNPLKHHLGYICNKLRTLPDSPDELKQGLFESIRSINANFVDVYTGRYSPEEVQEVITKELNRRNIGNVMHFQQWLGPKHYQMLSLDDQSVWILRKSEYKAAFVHIHPSRKPPLTVRVHGNAWRTVICLLVMHPEYLKEEPPLEKINSFRQEFLGLSPVKGRENLQRVMRVWNLIEQS